jgi:ribosomal subunit interface protein
MKTSIKWTNVTNTLELEKFIEEKIGELDKYLPENTQPLEAKVEIGRTTNHHQSGDIFHAVCDLRVAGKVLRAEANREDINQAVTEVKEELQKEIKNYKETMITKRRKGERLMKALKNYSPLAWGKEKFWGKKK